MPNPQEMSPTGYVLTMQPYNRNPIWDIPEPPPADRGLPMGGTTGQVLTKASDADYDAEWADQQGGGGTANYQDLENKPTIEGHTLNGDTSLTDIGAASAQALSTLENNVNIRDQELEGQIAAEQADRQLADSAINAALDKLKGGARGQYLKKNSQAENDFVWGNVVSDDVMPWIITPKTKTFVSTQANIAEGTTVITSKFRTAGDFIEKAKESALLITVTYNTLANVQPPLRNNYRVNVATFSRSGLAPIGCISVPCGGAVLGIAADTPIDVVTELILTFTHEAAYATVVFASPASRGYKLDITLRTVVV